MHNVDTSTATSKKWLSCSMGGDSMIHALRSKIAHPPVMSRGIRCV